MTNNEATVYASCEPTNRRRIFNILSVNMVMGTALLLCFALEDKSMCAGFVCLRACVCMCVYVFTCTIFLLEKLKQFHFEMMVVRTFWSYEGFFAGHCNIFPVLKGILRV